MLVQFLARSPSTNIIVRKLIAYMFVAVYSVHHTQETDGGWRSLLALHVQDLRVTVDQRSKRCGEQDSGE